MKLGVIGTGTIVKEFLPKICKLPGIEVKAILGVIETKDEIEQLCSENNIPHMCYDVEDFLELDIDTAYVAVPNSIHYYYCDLLLKNKKNVIVEKPMCSNYEESLRLQKLAKENELFLFEAVTTLYFDSYKKIREWLNEIGNIRLVMLNYSQYSRRYDLFKEGKILPVFDPEKSGGSMMDLNLYNLHFATGLFGEPESVHYFANMQKGIDTSGILIMRYPAFLVNCTSAKDCAAPYTFFIQGDKGYISTQYAPNLIGKVTLHLNDGSEQYYEDGDAMQRVIPEFRYFTEMINTHNLDGCNKMLDQSLLVSKLQTEARLQAGIIFPCDKKENHE